MTTIAATRPPVDSLKTPLILALILHAGLLVFALVGGYLKSRENSWGGPGGSVNVGIVGSLPAIPLPTPDVQNQSRVVDNSKGLYQSKPIPAPVIPPDATPIPEFLKSKPPKHIAKPKEEPPATPPEPKYNSRPSKLLENKTTPADNAVPYGGGGSPAIPRSSAFAMGTTGTTQAGLAFNGASGGDFGARFSWYVTAVQQRVASNWLQSTIDQNISWAPRVVVTFDILRNGAITNVQITQSSNNYSVDSSAMRAVQQSSPVMALPAAYGGSRVGVEFYFDYRRQ
ncbi:MAG TPA: TonB family protein [Candidatus Acidoferrales bacterium]|nr:TonB family protein [Candidatus Acidoferrales bacterium]